MSLAGEWKQGQEGHRQLSHDSPPVSPRVIESQRDAWDARGRRWRGGVNLAPAAGGGRAREEGDGGLLCPTASRSHRGRQSQYEATSSPYLSRPNGEVYLLSDGDEGDRCEWRPAWGVGAGLSQPRIIFQALFGKRPAGPLLAIAFQTSHWRHRRPQVRLLVPQGHRSTPPPPEPPPP